MNVDRHCLTSRVTLAVRQADACRTTLSNISELSLLRRDIDVRCPSVAEIADPHIRAYTPARREQFRSLNELSSPFIPMPTTTESGFCRRVLFFQLEMRKKTYSLC